MKETVAGWAKGQKVAGSVPPALSDLVKMVEVNGKNCAAGWNGAPITRLGQDSEADIWGNGSPPRAGDGSPCRHCVSLEIVAGLML